MSVAIDLLRVATAAGARFTVSGDRLTVTAPRPLPAELVDQLRRAKGEVIALLAADPVSSLEERAARAFAERAKIAMAAGPDWQQR